jgi:hypothetical protein
LFVLVSQPGFAAGILDCFQHLAQVVFDLGIDKPDEAVASIIDLLCALLILFQLRLVDTSVNLNNQPRFGAVEVGDEPPQRMLPAKLEPPRAGGGTDVPRAAFQQGS